jgi:hypothetical protein
VENSSAERWFAAILPYTAFNFSGEAQRRGLMFFRSLFWERTVLTLLEQVQDLPRNVQVEIANRAGDFIHLAKTATDEASLAKFAVAAVEERKQAVAQGITSKVDQRWAAPALAEAWCVAKIGLFNRSLDRHSATEVITAIDAFTATAEGRNTP